MEGFIVLIGLAVLAMPVLLVVALVSLSGVKRRVTDLEETVAQLRAHPPRAEGPVREATRPSYTVAEPSPPAATVRTEPTFEAPVAPPPKPAAASAAPATAHSMPSMDDAAPPPLPPRAAPAPFPPSPRATTPPPPTYVDVALRAVKRWFTVGNVPVKVGMLVLLAGVAALLKYASDQGWLRLPIEFRLAGIAAAAIAGLVFGWRQRERKPAFALALQGGAIGVLLLVVFASFKLYGMIPAGAAFAVSIALIAGLGVLAVLQDSRTLAVLGILAGFLAPIWLSTGSGNHVALFSYYAVLNAAIFGIAWFKSWRVLNLLGFVFTWGIGTLWGVLSYSPEKLASTQPFLALFFAFYLLIPILYARRRPPERRDLIDGCLLFGTPLVAFSLQAALLDGERMPLAFCALGVAAIYALLAWLLKRRTGYALLTRAYALLAVGFATLSVPLALSARATACVFALEGAALVWLGLRQRRLLPQATGSGLQMAAAVAFLFGSSTALAADAPPIANAMFMGALLIALAGFASAWWYRSAREGRIAFGWYLWALLWWCGNGLHEIAEFVGGDARIDAMLSFAALTGWLAAEANRLRPASPLATTTLVAMVAGIPFALAQTLLHQHPFADGGALAWLAFAALGVRSLICLRTDTGRAGDLAQFAWWLVWASVASLFAWWASDRAGLADGWRLVALMLPWLALALLSMRRWAWLRLPRGERFDALRGAFGLTVFLLLGLWWWWTQASAGSAAPLPWIPLLNPLELAQAGILVLFAAWLRSADGPRFGVDTRNWGLALAAFLLVTVVVLRAVHHWGAIPWNASLASTSLAQTSLTVTWSLLGMLGWIIGSRRGQHGVWLTGAVLMGVVLAKLVFVDRQHLGNLLGIGSFIAYGLLCTAVGWFAPAPPRRTGTTTTEASA